MNNINKFNQYYNTKSLNNYLKESILDDIDVQIDNTYEIIKNQIKKFICDNYICDISKIKISQNPNKNGKYRVEIKSKDAIKTIGNISELTNGMFNWGYVHGDFTIHSANISTLEGAPKEVGEVFYCTDCKGKFTNDDIAAVSNVSGEIETYEVNSGDYLFYLNKKYEKSVRRY